MTTAIRSSDDRMSLGRMWGMVNPETYSPREYAETMGPLIERRLRNSPLRVVASNLEPHNSGVSLTLVCERTFSLRPSKPGTPVNQVLFEHGQPKQRDYSATVSDLFRLAERLTGITLVDSQGQTHTFRKADCPLVESSPDGNAGLLDLTPLTEGVVLGGNDSFQ